VSVVPNGMYENTGKNVHQINIDYMANLLNKRATIYRSKDSMKEKRERK
jgi:hypothetical protein